jgi:WD40 repeat protein
MRTFTGHTGFINSVFVKGNYLYSGSEDSTIRKWDIRTGEAVMLFRSLFRQDDYDVESAVFSVFVHNDSLFSGSFSGIITQWNIDTGEIIKVFRGHTEFITCLYVQEGFLFSSSYDGTIRKWQISTGQVEHVFRGHSGPVTSFAITNRYLISGAGDATIRKWNIRNGEVIDVKSTDSDILCLTMRDDTIYFGSRDGTVRQLTNMGTIKLVHKIHTEAVICISIRDDRLFTGSGDTNVVQWNLSLGQMARVYRGHNDTVTCLFVDGDYLYSGSDDYKIVQWNIETDGVPTLTRAPNAYLNVAEEDSYVRAPGVYYPGVYNPPRSEEDSDEFENITSDASSISSAESISDCSNDNIITLEPYTQEEDPIKIYTFNNKTAKFQKSICITADELESHLRAGLNTKYPDMIMTIYTTPPDRNTSGHGGNATGKFVVKLPPFNMFFTLGSIDKLLKSRTRTWYALPLYGGKKRRIGNLDESFASSSHHGQIPGFVIYKVFTKEEIQSGVDVKATADDYPTIFAYNNSKILYDLIGEEVTIGFINKTIGDLISKNI